MPFRFRPLLSPVRRQCGPTVCPRLPARGSGRIGARTASCSDERGSRRRRAIRGDDRGRQQPRRSRGRAPGPQGRAATGADGDVGLRLHALDDRVRARPRSRSRRVRHTGGRRSAVFGLGGGSGDSRGGRDHPDGRHGGVGLGVVRSATARSAHPAISASPRCDLSDDRSPDPAIWPLRSNSSGSGIRPRARG